MAHQSTRREGVLAGDTIAAAATAAGKGAIGIVRLSGSGAMAAARSICGKELAPRVAEHCRFRSGNGDTIDSGIAIFFPGPASFTGEDVVELQCHGSPVVVDWLLEACYAAGARPAAPGEFSLRAYLNDKLDLAQAEAIADLIESGSRAAAKAATRSLAGAFSERVAELQESLTTLRVHCESWLDFPDEDIDRAASDALRSAWQQVTRRIDEVKLAASHGRKLSDGLNVAIAGLPNAGKSSLLNRLSGSDAAIVTAQAGTTRDTIRETVNLGGIALTLIDMAGIRDSTDAIESEGVRRATTEIEGADHVLWVADIRDGLESAQSDARAVVPSGQSFSLVLNKIDLIDGHANQFTDDVAVFALSVKTGDGVEALVAHLHGIAGIADTEGGGFSARRRHVDALEKASRHVHAAGPMLESSLELAAEELKLAQAELDALTGEHTSDELLGEIFSSFCIGK